MILIKASEIYLKDKILYDSTVAVENGRIVEIGGSFKGECEIIDLGRLKLLPGFLDIHVHGGNGFDTMDATYEALSEISKYKLLEGVTAFCPTTVSDSRENIINAMDCIGIAKERGVPGARIIWPFIEGPFINFARKGAHSGEFVDEKPDEGIVDLLAGYDGGLSVLIAPELDGAMDIIKALKHRGINVRIGHSNADYETAVNAAENGGNIVAHMFNAMAPFSAREPGILAAGLLCDKLYTEIICDMVHSHRASLKLLFRAKGKDKIILITDCMRAGGLGDGNYTLGGRAVKVKGGIARTAEGNLAGSTLRIIDAVKNLYENFDLDLHDIINMATINPAEALGIDNENGSIACSKVADLIAVDDKLNIRFVMVGGMAKINMPSPV